MLALGLGASAQISYSQDWTATGLNGWSTSGSIFSRTSTANQICGTTGGTIRGERYFGNSGQFTSPLLTGNNQGQVSFTFDYKATVWSAGTVAATAANFGTVTVEYASAVGGPWSSALTLDSSNHIASTSCATKTATFTPAPGDVYVRFNVTSASGADLYYYFDNVVVSQSAAPTCFVPTAVTAAATSTTAATLSWTAPASVPANGYDIYYSTANTAPTAATVPTTTSATTSKSLTGLTSNVTYYAWVRSNCSAADQSSWVGTSFYTGYCVPSVSGTGYWITSFTSSTATTNANYTGTSTGPAGYRDLTASLKIANSADSVTPIIISMGPSSNAGFAVWIDWNNDLVFQASEKVYGTTSYTTTTSGATITVPTATPVGNYRMRIAMNYSNSTITDPCAAISSGEYIDATFEVVPPPTCIAPTAPTSVSNTSTTADISWTASTSAPALGYEIYYSTSATAPTAATPATVTGITGTTTTLPGLMSATKYYAYVRANCSAADQSAWTVATEFITLCNPFTVTYTENFDSSATGSSINNNAPVCWKYLETVASAGYGYISTGSPKSGLNSYYLYNSSDNTGNMMLVSPLTTNLMNGNNRVTFFAKGSAGYVLDIGTVSDNVDASTFTSISPITLTATYALYTVNIPAGTNGYLAFRHGLGGTVRGIYIDDITVEAIPSCLAPSDLLLSNPTLNTLDASWTASASTPALGYQIYYSTTNTAPTAATTPSVTGITGTSTTVSGLASSTSYYMWVRANCAAADQSAWSLSAVASTSCATTTVPYNVDFETATVGGTEPCTTLENAGTGNNWAVKNNNGYGFTTNALVYTYNGTNAANAWFYTNGITLPVGAYTITYDYGSTSFDEKLKVAYGTSATAAAMTNVIATYDPVTPKGVKNTASLDVNITTAGVYYFGFNAFSDADQLYLAIDNISIIAKPLATTDIVKVDRTFSIAPNPFTDVVRISDLKDVVSISIVDLSGRIVKTVKPAREIQLGDLKTGMYLINLKMKDGSVQTVKAIKK